MASATGGLLQVKQVEVGRLVPWERNPRMNERAVNPVAKSIKRFGFNVPILCNRDYRIIAGHTRWRAAKKLGLRRVPVVQLNLSSRDEAAFAIADNKTGGLADWDNAKLRAILDELSSEDTDLSSLGFSSRELRRLLKTERDSEDFVPEQPKRLRTAQGTLWKLGRHRLLCGDSRHRTIWRRLLGSEKVDHIFAGPPYFNQRAYSHWDDHAAYLRDMAAVIGHCREALKQGAVIVWNIGNGSSTGHPHVAHHAVLLQEAGFRFLDMIIWNKLAATFHVPRHAAIKKGIYYPAHQWEALHVYQKPGKMPTMSQEGIDYMWQNRTDIWEVLATNRQTSLHGHPAICPVEIPFRSIIAYTNDHGRVVDPFGGSGTTLIAAERLGRRAFLIEKHAQYCDVIVNRWEKLTGKRAKIISGKASN